MKAWNAAVKKCLVILLTITYLFIAVIYLLYLPKFSRLRIGSNYIRANSQIEVKPSHQLKGTGFDVLVLIHRAYKSTVENKREMFSELLQIDIVLVLIIVTGVSLRQLTIRVIKHHRPQQYAYMSYRVLRI